MPDAAESSKGAPGGQPESRLIVSIVLAAAAATGAFLLLLAPAFTLSDPVTADIALAEPQQQSAETALFLLGFLVLLPLAAVFSLKLCDRVGAGPNRDAIAGLAALTVTGLMAVIALTRAGGAIDLGGLRVLFVLTAAWAVVTGLIWWRAAGEAWGPAEKIADRTGWLVGIAWGAAGLAILCVGYLSHVDPAWLLGGLVAAAVALRFWWKDKGFRVGRKTGVGLDASILVLIVLAVPDMVIMRGPLETGLPGDPFDTYVMQAHQALFIGAVSQVLHGSALLVDTVSQYGIGSIYLLAAWFNLAPLGNGTLGFFDAVLSALMFAGGYATLRLAGVGRLLSASALAVAIVVLVYGLTYPIGGLLQHGGLRFGLPVPLIVFWVAATRFNRGRRWWRLAGWGVIGLSSIWALEAFIYVTGAAAGMIALEAVLAEPGCRRRLFLRGIAGMLLAWVVFQAAFALATLIVTGQLPDWGLYLTYLRDFLTGEVGEITYDVPAWSPGITVGVAWGVAALAIAMTAWQRPDWLRERRPAAVALAGLIGFGICLYSYFDNRSLPHVLPYLCLPLVLVGTLWLDQALRASSLSRVLKASLFGSALVLSALSVSIVMPPAADRAKTSLLAELLPGGRSARASFDRFWNMPEMFEGADSGAALLDEYMPDEDESAVLTVPDLDNAILIRSDRANALRITDAKEDSWVEGPHIAWIEEAVRGLEPGDRMLLDDHAYAAFRELRRNPGADPEGITAETGLADIQVRALGQIAGRFRPKELAARDGFVVIELEPAGRP